VGLYLRWYHFTLERVKNRMTRDNDKIVEMLKRHEGVVKNNDRHVVYKCSENFLTLGIGRNIDPNGGLGLSDSEVDFMLSNDVDRVIAELGKAFSWFTDLDCVRADAMIDLCFQLGLPSLLKFKNFLAEMAEGNYELAAPHLLDSLYARQTPNRANEIAEMIVSGKYK